MRKLRRKTLEHYGYHPERNGKEEKLVETTRIVQVVGRLSPTLTHITTCDPVISGAEDDAMSPGVR